MTRTVVNIYSNECNGQETMKGWGQKRKGGVKFLNERRSKAPAPASTPGPAHAEAREPDSAPPTNTSELREAPSQGIFWAFHTSQIDEDNKFQPWSSAQVRQNIQGLLLGDRGVYREHFSIVSRMNPAIAAAVHDHTVSKANLLRYERSRSLFGYNDDSDASDTEEEAAAVGAEGFAKFGREHRRDVRWAQNHSRSTEFIVSMMMRWYNMHSHCFFLYALSCIFFATGLSEFAWNLLQSMRIVYSKDSIRDSMLQIGRQMMQRRWDGTSRSIGFCVSDNCAYMNKLTFQHAEKDGKFYETVNYLYFPLGRLRSGRLPELPSSGALFYEFVICAMPTGTKAS